MPRVFEKVHSLPAERRQRRQRAKLFTDRRAAAVDWSELATANGPGLLLRAKHAALDRLVYRKLRAALGGNCCAAVAAART